MAIQEIVLAINAYIDRLKEARELIASLYIQSDTSGQEPMKRKTRLKPHSAEVPVSQPETLEVAVQVIPARVARRQRSLKKPESPTFSALGGPIPKGPVVVHSSDLARMKSSSNQAHPPRQSRQPGTSPDLLEDLVQEVAQRLASNGGFSY
jgi:hypothetical protein